MIKCFENVSKKSKLTYCYKPHTVTSYMLLKTTRIFFDNKYMVYSLVYAELRNPGILFNIQFLAVHSSFSPKD